MTAHAAGAVTDRIAGSLLGAAIGDAMGAATELRTHEQIIEYFGGPVRGFVPAPDDTFARGRPAGSITDDFSLAYYLARAIVARGGTADERTGGDAVIAWWADERFRDFAGPTTRVAIDRLLGKPVEEPPFLYRGGQATNGAAMRVAPVGCVAATVDAAVEQGIRVSLPTHDNHLAAGAAGLVAAAVRLAMDLEPAGSDGAGSGRPFAGLVAAVATLAPAVADRARELSYEVYGAEIEHRLAIALALGRGASDAASAALAIARTVGCGIAANEAVPAVFGILAAASDPMDAIIAAVNAGDDADTVATMVGAIAGAAFGASAFPAELVETVQRVNEVDLAALAAELGAVRA